MVRCTEGVKYIVEAAKSLCVAETLVSLLSQKFTLAKMRFPERKLEIKEGLLFVWIICKHAQ